MPQFRYDLHDISARNDAEIKGELLTRLIQLALNIYSDEPRERLRELLDLIDTVIDQPTARDVLESLLRYAVQGTRRLEEQDVRTLLIEHRPGEPLMQTFIEKYKAPVIEEDQHGKHRPTGGRGNRRGTPQSGVASPLLANLYLHLLDRIWVRHDLERRLGARLVRYADDVVILCRRGTEKPMAVLATVLEKLDLTLTVQKTCVVDARADGFDVLGFGIAWRTSRRSGTGYPHVEPSKRAEQRIKDRVTERTARRRTPVALTDMLGDVNQALRGWSGSFHDRNCSQVLGRVKTHAEERVRTHLRRRHKRRSRAQGYARFPNAHLYAHVGLFKVPTTAGWTSAHASA